MNDLKSVSTRSLLIVAVATVLLAACGTQRTPPESPAASSEVAARMAGGFHTRDSAWVTLAPMPTARNAFGIAAVNGKIYVAGGWGYTGPDTQGVQSVLEVYDPMADAWTTKAPMPTARNALAAAAVGGKIYAIGGWTGTENTPKVERYDPATDTWSEVSPMNAAKSGLAAAAVGGKIYALGGDTMEVYDPHADTWTVTASTNWAPRWWLGAAGMHGKLYAVGGSLSGDPANLADLYDTAQVYDPDHDAWETLAPLPIADAMLAAVAVDERLYAIGGAAYDQVSPFAGTVMAYDRCDDRWAMRAPLNLGRNGHGAVAVNGVVYVVGGWDWFGPVAALEKYAFPTSRVTIKGDYCLVWGNDFVTPQYVITTDTTEMIRQDEIGHVTVTCRASGVYNGTGQWVMLSSDDHPDFPCYAWSDPNTWQPPFFKWMEFIAPNGDATLWCWYP